MDESPIKPDESEQNNSPRNDDRQNNDHGKEDSSNGNSKKQEYLLDFLKNIVSFLKNLPFTVQVAIAVSLFFAQLFFFTVPLPTVKHIPVGSSVSNATHSPKWLYNWVDSAKEEEDVTLKCKKVRVENGRGWKLECRKDSNPREAKPFYLKLEEAGGSSPELEDSLSCKSSPKKLPTKIHVTYGSKSKTGFEIFISFFYEKYKCKYHKETLSDTYKTKLEELLRVELRPLLRQELLRNDLSKNCKDKYAEELLQKFEINFQEIFKNTIQDLKNKPLVDEADNTKLGSSYQVQENIENIEDDIYKK